MSLRKFFSAATTSRQDEDATSGDDPVLPRRVVLVHPHRPTGLIRRILGLILNGKPSGSG